jgi:hypothetical protein
MNHPQVDKEQATGLLLPALAPKGPRFNLSRIAWLVIIVPFFAGEDPLDQRAGLGFRWQGWTDRRGPASNYNYLKKLGKIGRSGKGDSETKGIESLRWTMGTCPDKPLAEGMPSLFTCCASEGKS